jgi:hypothetical protein
MATVRHLGLFSLPTLSPAQATIPISSCPQPAESFEVQVSPTTKLEIAPATLPSSGYVPMSLTRAMLWQWRIKEWLVTINANYVPDDRPLAGSFILPNVFLDNEAEEGVTAFATETQKVCSNQQGGGFFFTNRIYGDIENAVGDWEEISVEIGGSEVAWANYPNLPKITRRASQGVRFASDKTTFYINVSVVFGAVAEDLAFYGSGSLALDGSNLPLTLVIEDGIQTFSKPFQLGDEKISGEIRITPHSFWPYDPEDGLGPIYDKDTGAQLRPFPQ